MIVREFDIQPCVMPKQDPTWRFALGASPQTSAGELRQNMALLMRWLHPDKNPTDARAVFVSRINRAWDDLKTPERRQAYDRDLAARQSAPKSDTSRGAHRVGRTGSSSKQAMGLPQRRELRPSDLLDGSRTGRLGFWRWASSFFRRR